MGLRGQEGFEFEERKRKKSFKEDGIEKLLLLLLLSLSIGGKRRYDGNFESS